MKKFKILSSFVIISTLVLCVQIFTYAMSTDTETDDHEFLVSLYGNESSWGNERNSCAIRGFKETAVNVVVPATVIVKNKEYKVTRLSNFTSTQDRALNELINSNKITYLDLSQANNLILICTNAFCSRENLKGNLFIPRNVKKIGANAFLNCSGLESLTFEKDSTLTEIGRSAFYYCKNICGRITFPASLEKFNDDVFADCLSLESIRFENADNLKSIGRNVFIGCSLLPESIVKSFAEKDRYYGETKVSNGFGGCGYYMSDSTYTCREMEMQLKNSSRELEKEGAIVIRDDALHNWVCNNLAQLWVLFEK